VTDTACTTIGRSVTVDMAGPSIVFPMTGLTIQRTKFVDANTASIVGTLAVKSAKPPVFGPELTLFDAYVPEHAETLLFCTPRQHPFKTRLEAVQ